MEIISTGGLPSNLSKEDFFKGVSKPVNEELAKLFIRLDLMEQTGYGVPLVSGRYGKKAFEFLDFFLRVTIPFAFELEVEEGVPQGVPQSVPQGFSEMQKKIFQCIKENPKVSRQKIAEKLGVSMKTIARNLLQMKNCVQFVGRGYSGHWEIVG
jgi:predicted HTH transcriptional regulator